MNCLLLLRLFNACADIWRCSRRNFCLRSHAEMPTLKGLFMTAKEFNAQSLRQWLEKPKSSRISLPLLIDLYFFLLVTPKISCPLCVTTTGTTRQGGDVHSNWVTLAKPNPLIGIFALYALEYWMSWHIFYTHPIFLLHEDALAQLSSDVPSILYRKLSANEAAAILIFEILRPPQ